MIINKILFLVWNSGKNCKKNQSCNLHSSHVFFNCWDDVHIFWELFPTFLSTTPWFAFFCSPRKQNSQRFSGEIHMNTGLLVQYPPSASIRTVRWRKLRNLLLNGIGSVKAGDSPKWDEGKPPAMAKSLVDLGGVCFWSFLKSCKNVPKKWYKLYTKL